MAKNFTLRFVVVFLTFVTSVIFLVATLYRAIALDDENKYFETDVLTPLARLSNVARDFHIAGLHRLLTASIPPLSEITFPDIPKADTVVSEVFSHLETFGTDTHYLALPANEVETLRQEWIALKKSRLKFLKAVENTPKNSKAVRKTAVDYFTKYQMFLKSIDEIRKHFLQNHQTRINEEKRSLHAYFYLAVGISLLTLILLAFLLYEVNALNRRLKKYLEEREEYQKRLSEANRALAHHSEKLESEVKKRTAEALEHLKTNPLTKLPNRLNFLEHLAKSSHASVAIFNIDRFQSYNDLFGPKVGDRIIRAYAAYLRQTIPYIYQIYHLAGDEFAVAEQNRKNAATFLAMIQQVSKLVREFHFHDKHGDLILQVSIGAAIDQQRPLVKADMALKHAKQSQENFVVYSDKLIKPQQYLENITMTKELTEAIKEERIVPWFQPIADTKTGAIQKYEVLARLVDSQGVIHSPARFIPLAKKIRLYSEITKNIFRQSLDIVEKYGIHVSINLSADDIHHAPTRNYIIDRLALSEFSDHVTFELLESEEARNYDEIRHFIQKVKHYGVRIAIDDFGSGYSNFAKILKLKIDYLKIDGSFVKKIDNDEENREFVGIIHHLANHYGIQTVAEFVSNPAIYRAVKEIGVDYVQGYEIAEPMPFEKVLKESFPPFPD